MYDSDQQFKYLASSLFTPLDGTSHEETFVGWNELPKGVPITNLSWLSVMKDEEFPQSDKLVEIAEPEKMPRTGTGVTYKSIIEARFADVEEEEADDEYGADGGGDDDYGDDYGEEGEGGDGDEEEGGEEAEYGDYGEEAEPTWPPKVVTPHSPASDRFFLGTEDVRDKYDDNEVDAFMRLLAIRPNMNWQDKSTHHYKVGVHRYEDDSQEMDPAFHTLSEVERKHADEETTK